MYIQLDKLGGSTVDPTQHGPNVTLHELQTANVETGSAIIVYANQATCAKYPHLLWSQACISSPWPNVATYTDLWKYLQPQTILHRDNQFYCTQALLTPDTSSIIRKLDGSLIEFSSSTGDYVTESTFFTCKKPNITVVDGISRSLARRIIDLNIPRNPKFVKVCKGIICDSQ